MLEINTIADFDALSGPHRSAILKELKTKIRLEDWHRAQNKKRARRSRLKQVITIPRDPIVIRPRDGTDIHPSSVTRCLKRIWMDCTSIEMDIEEIAYDERGDPRTDPLNGNPITEIKRRMVPYSDLVEENIDPRLQMIFDTGSAWHKVMQGYGHKGAWGPRKNYSDEVEIDPDAKDENGEIINPLAEKFWVKGACDGVVAPYFVTVPGLGKVAIRVIHEYKTINSNGYKNLSKPKSDHMWQATVYAKMLDIPVAIYLYTNKDNQQTADFPVAFDHHLWAKIEEKIVRVQWYVENNQCPPWEETAAVLNARECTECGHFKLCSPPQQSVKKLTARR
jgi:hypothetical protein